MAFQNKECSKIKKILPICNESICLQTYFKAFGLFFDNAFNGKKILIIIQQKCFTLKRIKNNFMPANSTMPFMNTDAIQHNPYLQNSHMISSKTL